MGLLVFDEVVAALAPFVGGPARNGKHLAMVAMGQISGHQTTSFFSRLYDNGSFADSCNDSVSLQEILSIGLTRAPEFGHKTTIGLDFGLIFGVCFGVNLIQAMRHAGNRLQSVVHRRLLHLYIHTISQSTYDNGVQRRQFGYKLLGKGTPVAGHIPRAHHADDFLLLQIDIAPLEQKNGAIQAMLKAFRIGVIHKIGHLNVFLGQKFDLLLGFFQILGIMKSF